MTIVINGTTGISGVDGSAGTPAVQGTDTNTGVFYPAADTVGVSTGGSERVRVDSSGNVGIGTTNTTDQRLKVKQSADTGASSFSFKVEANANDTGLYIGYRGAGAATAADTCAITATYGSTGAFKPMTFLTSDAERMRIDSSGNVGIGTSSPSVKLEVSGPVYSAQNNYIRIGNAYLSSGGDYCHLANNTYFNGSVWTSSANGAMYQMTGQAHNWYTQTSNAFTAVAVITSTGNFQFNSGYGSVATAYGCRAWVNFNGTTSPGTIRGSGNVTSVTKNGTGDYTVNFTNAMPDANYSMTSSSANTGPTMSVASPQLAATPFTTTTARVETRNTVSGSLLDCQFVCLGFFR